MVMKLRHLLPPLAAAVVVGVWIGVQRSAVTQQRRAVAELHERIRAAENPDGKGFQRRPPSAAAGRDRFEGKDGRIDWMAVLHQLQSRGGESTLTDIRTSLRLHERFNAWSAAELADALHEIRNLDIDDADRLKLEQQLAGPLGNKDPGMTMELLGHRIRDGGGWWLAGAMTEWVGSDPAAAIAWLDRAVDNGTFASKSLSNDNGARRQFEAIVLRDLINTGAPGAEARIAALGGNERRDVFSRLATEWVDPDRYVSLVRGSSDDPAAATRIIASAAASKAQVGGYAQATAFLDGGRVTGPERREAVAESAIRRIQHLARRTTIGTADIDEMREWVKVQSPGTEDRLTGQAIARTMAGGEAVAGIPLVLGYHNASGNDEVLAAFIREGRRLAWKDQAAALVKNIGDPALRRELMDRFAEPDQ